jgi:hypothetical protein
MTVLHFVEAFFGCLLGVALALLKNASADETSDVEIPRTVESRPASNRGGNARQRRIQRRAEARLAKAR